jgi:MFS transporter, DHA2 family, multidrug resistance protein
MAAGTPDTFESLSAHYGAAYRWLVVITCLTAMLGMVLSSVSMNVAVPSVMGAFGVGQDQAQWVATGYLASMVIGMLLNSWLVAALGLRLTLIIIISVFLVASVIGAFSTNIEMLILSRIMQGVPAGVMQPFSMMVNFQVFPPERRGTAMGIFGMGVVLAPVFGPLLGGTAIDMLGWRYIFAMPLPLIAIAAVLGPIFLPERAQKGPFPPFDWTGLALLVGALALVLGALTSGQRLGWLSDEIVGRGAIGVGFVVAFVWWEGKAKRPLLDFSLFRNPRFACAMAVSFIFGICLFGSAYVVPVFAQIVQGYSAMRAGWLLAAAGGIMILMFPLSGRMADTVPPNLLISSGLFIFGTGFIFIHTVDVNTSFLVMAGLSAFTRIGLSCVITPLNATSLRYVPPEKLANASSNANFFRQLGGGMGIAILVAVLDTRITFHASNLSATQTPANLVSTDAVNTISDMLLTTGIPESVRQAVATDYLGRIVYANASMFGFQDVFLTLALITLSALVPAWFLRKPKPFAAMVHKPAEQASLNPPPAPVPLLPPEPLPKHTPLQQAARRMLHHRRSHRSPAPVMPARHASRR